MRVFPESGWRFCRTLGCPVVYFHDTEDPVECGEVSAEIAQKSERAGRPVCYCFGYSAADIWADPEGLVVEDIKARCRSGEDRCGETNPQGSCCLGNVSALRRAAGWPR